MEVVTSTTQVDSSAVGPTTTTQVDSSAVGATTTVASDSIMAIIFPIIFRFHFLSLLAINNFNHLNIIICESDDFSLAEDGLSPILNFPPNGVEDLDKLLNLVNVSHSHKPVVALVAKDITAGIILCAHF